MTLKKIHAPLFGTLVSTSLVMAAAWVGATHAADIGEPGRGSGMKNPLNNVYFGEQHLHTQDSPDAFAMGTRNTQDDACAPTQRQRLYQPGNI